MITVTALSKALLVVPLADEVTAGRRKVKKYWL